MWSKSFEVPFKEIIRTYHFPRIDQVDWQGDNICVMGKVLIAPPYKPENIKGASDSKAVVHVRKIVSIVLTLV